MNGGFLEYGSQLEKFFNGPNPKAMQFMMPEDAIDENAEVAVLLDYISL